MCRFANIATHQVFGVRISYTKRFADTIFLKTYIRFEDKQQQEPQQQATTLTTMLDQKLSVSKR